MADLLIKLLGDATGLTDAMKSGEGALLSAQRAVIDFTKQSVKAYAESERVQRQLQLVAKDLTGAFQQQATAMAQANNISDELVQQMQTMLLRYGEAPGAVKSTTQAVLDYAAATGTDARTATELLTRGVETGTGHFKGLGISIAATGDRTRDLAAATAELARKYGGAGEADANSVTGQVRGLEEAFGDLQEMFGGFIAEVANKTGVIETLTTALRRAAEGFQILSNFTSNGGGSALARMIFKPWQDIGGGNNFDTVKSSLALALKSGVQTPVDVKLQESAFSRANGNGEMYGPSAPRPEDVVAMAEAEALRKKQAQALRDALAKSHMDEGVYGPQTYAAWAASTPSEGPAAPTGDEWASMAKAKKEAAKDLAEAHAKAMEDSLKAVRETAHKLAEEQKLFAKAGADMGAALANNLTSALEQLAGGGEKDVGKIIANILAGLLTAGGGIIGNLLLPGIGGAVGSALGGLAGAGVRAAANAGPQVNINTFDARSTREFFEADGGRGLTNAKRTGRGQGW